MQKMNINKHHQQGVGLIEVLVSLLLLAVAVLGYSALQLTAVKLTHESTQRTQATMILRNLGEQLRINPAGLGTYIEALNKGDLTKPTKGCGLYGQTSAVCSAHQLAVVEAYQIQQKLTKYGLSLHLQACPANRANSTCGIISWAIPCQQSAQHHPLIHRAVRRHLLMQIPVLMIKGRIKPKAPVWLWSCYEQSPSGVFQTVFKHALPIQTGINSANVFKPA